MEEVPSQPLTETPAEEVAEGSGEVTRAAVPDPSRPFWWFSSDAIPSKRLPAGMPVECPAGFRLPPEADYWCHEGDEKWARVDRDLVPKPPPEKRKAAPRKPRGETP